RRLTPRRSGTWRQASPVEDSELSGRIPIYPSNNGHPPPGPVVIGVAREAGVIMAIWPVQVRHSRDHGQLPRSTSVNVAFRIWCVMPVAARLPDDWGSPLTGAGVSHVVQVMLHHWARILRC